MFEDYHVFIPMTRFVLPNGSMSIVNALENGTRVSLLLWTMNPLVDWLADRPNGHWSWIVLDKDPYFNDHMDQLYGENWPEWRDYCGNRLVRFSFNDRHDALLFKLTVV